MKNLTLALVLVATILLFTGCTGVYVAQPIGDKPHVLVAADWEGTWTSDGGAVLVRITDSAAGKLQYSETQIENGAFVTKTTDVFVRESGDWLFASIRDEHTPDRFEWARIKRDGDRLFVWAPEKEAFRALVQSGKLRGQLLEQYVLLAPLSPEQMQSLTSGALGAPFSWDNPVVLQRLRRQSQ